MKLIYLRKAFECTCNSYKTYLKNIFNQLTRGVAMSQKIKSDGVKRDGVTKSYICTSGTARAILTGTILVYAMYGIIMLSCQLVGFTSPAFY